MTMTAFMSHSLLPLTTCYPSSPHLPTEPSEQRTFVCGACTNCTIGICVESPSISAVPLPTEPSERRAPVHGACAHGAARQCDAGASRTCAAGTAWQCMQGICVGRTGVCKAAMHRLTWAVHAWGSACMDCTSHTGMLRIPTGDGACYAHAYYV